MRDSKLHRPALNAISRCLISKVSANLIALVITETSQDLPITMSCRFLISDLFILYSLPVVVEYQYTDIIGIVNTFVNYI